MKATAVSASIEKIAGEHLSRRSSKHPLREISFGMPSVTIDRRDDGTIYVVPQQPLADYPVRITDRLYHWAEKAPDRVLVAERDAEGGWRTVTYAQILAFSRHIASGLIARGLSAEKPLVMARSFNNMHFNVSDLDRTATFYKNLLGTTVHAKSADGSGYSLLFPNSTAGRKTWLGIKKAPAAATGPYTHMGISIDIDDGANSMENLAVAINKRFTFAKAKAVGKAVGGKKGARAVSMLDPDGMPFELCRHDDDGAV